MLKPVKEERESRRFYLFAGMGGRPTRRKHRRFLLYALITAVLASLVLGGVFYWINAP